MQLFKLPPDNLLPYDGEVQYFRPVLNKAQCDRYFSELFNAVPWQHDELLMFGKRVTTKRKVAWYGDSNVSYTYSNTTKTALPWIPQLKELKAIAEEKCMASFNSCLLNLYHDGTEGMAWHADDEKELGLNPVIASMSFGSERRFVFKHKVTGEKRELVLEDGSLLLMCGVTQHHWLHALPKAMRVKDARISLTFRHVIAL